jgi:peptidoglycan/xylan/chitin deacetylase (PgdA/CDA1 family)
MNQPFDLTVLLYHYVRDKGDAAESGSEIPGLPVQVFVAQLDELAKRHTFVSWREVRLALQEGGPLPDSACLLTFDDGVRDHYLNVFKILQDRNLSGLFFVLDRREDRGLILAHKIHFLLAKLGLAGLREAIWDKLNSLEREQFAQAEQRYQAQYPSTPIDGEINLLKVILQRELSAPADPILRGLFEIHIGSEEEIARNYYLNREQIHEMSAGGMHFGGHSCTHPWFDFIDTNSREREIRASAEWLQQIEPKPWAFAYPYGGLSEDSPELLGRHGFVAAFTTKTQLRHSNPFFIGRVDGEEMTQVGDRYG